MHSKGQDVKEYEELLTELSFYISKSGISSELILSLFCKRKSFNQNLNEFIEKEQWKENNSWSLLFTLFTDQQ